MNPDVYIVQSLDCIEIRDMTIAQTCFKGAKQSLCVQQQAINLPGLLPPALCLDSTPLPLGA